MDADALLEFPVTDYERLDRFDRLVREQCEGATWICEYRSGRLIVRKGRCGYKRCVICGPFWARSAAAHYFQRMHGLQIFKQVLPTRAAFGSFYKAIDRAQALYVAIGQTDGAIIVLLTKQLRDSALVPAELLAPTLYRSISDADRRPGARKLQGSTEWAMSRRSRQSKYLTGDDMLDEGDYPIVRLRCREGRHLRELVDLIEEYTGATSTTQRSHWDLQLPVLGGTGWDTLMVQLSEVLEIDPLTTAHARLGSAGNAALEEALMSLTTNSE